MSNEKEEEIMLSEMPAHVDLIDKEIDLSAPATEREGEIDLSAPYR
jgi:hypothetical protein